MLQVHGITAVADVRSSPYSRYNPQFNKEALQTSLKNAGIAYVFLGKELGARSEDPTCCTDGKARFDLIAKSQTFTDGLQRLCKGMKTHRISLMCAEKDPMTCHRAILVCRHLRSPAVDIQHILEDGTLEPNPRTERRLMRLLNIQENNLFATHEELIEKAYDLQGQRIAYQEKQDGNH